MFYAGKSHIARAFFTELFIPVNVGGRFTFLATNLDVFVANLNASHHRVVINSCVEQQLIEVMRAST